jgi:hypothetical protein
MREIIQNQIHQLYLELIKGRKNLAHLIIIVLQFKQIQTQYIFHVMRNEDKLMITENKLKRDK